MSKLRHETIPSAVVGRARTKAHFLVGPGGIECFEVVRLRIRLCTKRFELRLIELHARQCGERSENRFVRRFPPGQTLAEGCEDVPWLSDQFDCIGGFTRRGELEEQRQEVGQLGCGRAVSGILVELEQIDHRLSAIAAFAVDVLKQMQR